MDKGYKIISASSPKANEHNNFQDKESDISQAS